LAAAGNAHTEEQSYEGEYGKDWDKWGPIPKVPCTPAPEEQQWLASGGSEDATTSQKK
jgi:hypothetical protein